MFTDPPSSLWLKTETRMWTWNMWQKDFDPSLHKNMSPFWWTKKSGFFTPLPPIWTNVSFSAIFFLTASLTLSEVRYPWPSLTGKGPVVRTCNSGRENCGSCKNEMFFLNQVNQIFLLIVLKLKSESKTVPGFDNWPRFVGVIEQHKIQGDPK